MNFPSTVFIWQQHGISMQLSIDSDSNNRSINFASMDLDLLPCASTSPRYPRSTLILEKPANDLVDIPRILQTKTSVWCHRKPFKACFKGRGSRVSGYKANRYHITYLQLYRIPDIVVLITQSIYLTMVFRASGEHSTAFQLSSPPGNQVAFGVRA